MKITSRYADAVDIDPAKVPEELRHLLPLAREWSLRDYDELDAYIEATPPKKKRELVDGFMPHFDAIWEWQQRFEDLVPWPEELCLFDFASDVAETVLGRLLDEGAYP